VEEIGRGAITEEKQRTRERERERERGGKRLAEKEKEQAEYTCGSRRPTGREREPVDAE